LSDEPLDLLAISVEYQRTKDLAATACRQGGVPVVVGVLVVGSTPFKIASASV
jgi:hypothetical protein